METFTIGKQARYSAKYLLTQAKENEPPITADLEAIASKVSAETVGLENKFKSEISIARKLIQTAKSDSVKINRVTNKFNDALRYTFILPFETYTKGFNQTVKALRKSGYQIPENKIWNAWKNIGTVFDRGYRGINITVISSRKQKFELQFHTAESFGFKTDNHHLYKESKMRETLPERKREIAGFLVKTAKKVPVPEGVRQ